MSHVAVVGLGKLGSVLAGVLADRGHWVIGVDVNAQTVKEVNMGRAPVWETGLQELYTRAAFNLSADTSMKLAVSQTTIAFVIVPTPSDDTGAFTNKYVLEAVTSIGEALKDQAKAYTVVICSTVMPGSCEGPITAALEESSGRKVGVDVGLCYSPEFIALGSVIRDMTYPDMVLMGSSDEDAQGALADVLMTVPLSDPEYLSMSLIDAEIAKIGLNTFVTMKISFANLLGEICQRSPGANADHVTAAIGADSRVGIKYFKPGGAYGGPCFVRDTKAFSVLAADRGVSADLAVAAQAINLRQAENLACRLAVLNRVTVLGLAYKPQTSITECSFGVDLVKLLQFEGVVVTTYDPYSKHQIDGNNVALTLHEAIGASEVIVVATPWPEFAKADYTDKRVIDMWGIVPEQWHPERFGRA